MSYTVKWQDVPFKRHPYCTARLRVDGGCFAMASRDDMYSADSAHTDCHTAPTSPRGEALFLLHRVKFCPASPTMRAQPRWFVLLPLHITRFGPFGVFGCGGKKICNKLHAEVKYGQSDEPLFDRTFDRFYTFPRDQWRRKLVGGSPSQVFLAHHVT